MACLSLHEPSNDIINNGACPGLHSNGTGGYVHVEWGGVVIVFHADNLTELRKRLESAAEACGELLHEIELQQAARG